MWKKCFTVEFEQVNVSWQCLSLVSPSSFPFDLLFRCQFRNYSLILVYYFSTRWRNHFKENRKSNFSSKKWKFKKTFALTAIYTAWKVSVFSRSISLYSVQRRENTDQKNSDASHCRMETFYIQSLKNYNF